MYIESHAGSNVTYDLRQSTTEKMEGSRVSKLCTFILKSSRSAYALKKCG